MSLSSVTAQDKLKARPAPYWHKLGKGLHVGIRKSAKGTTWHARVYDSGTREQVRKALGDFAHLPPSDRFDAASKAAREWAEHMGQGGRREEWSVGRACDRYVRHIRETKGEAAAADMHYRFRRTVYASPLASVRLTKLKAHHLREWKRALMAAPKLVPRRGKPGKPKPARVTREKRTAQTVNRDLTPLRAALNNAMTLGAVTTDAAWRVELKPIKEPPSARRVYLDPDQRRALIAHLPPDLAGFVTGLCLLPLRPGTLAKLTVADFDRRDGTLHVRADKAGAGRAILLPRATADLLIRQCQDKLPGAPLFARWDGRAWDRDAWKKPIREAAAAAGLPTGTVAYSLRHSGITDLVTAGLDLFTVAALSGTSVAMIEKHYGKLRQERAQTALAGLAL